MGCDAILTCFRQSMAGEIVKLLVHFERIVSSVSSMFGFDKVASCLRLAELPTDIFIVHTAVFFYETPIVQ